MVAFLFAEGYNYLMNKLVELVSIHAITPYEKNAKEHPEGQVEKIANSIKAFGFNQPIVVDKNDVIIVGHGRYQAAQKLGMVEVPVIKLDIGEDAANAYRLADNKLNESEWDMKLVIDELKTMDEAMIELTGFSKDLLIDVDEKDDVVPAGATGDRIHLGEVWKCGEHYLMCGDSTNPDMVRTLVMDQRADMIFTDPPYNVNYKGRGKETSEGIKGDDVSDTEFDTFLDWVFKNYKASLKPGGGMYVFHSTSSQKQFQDAIERNGFEIKNQLIWNKPTASMGWGDYRWKHEPFFYAGIKRVKTQFYGDRRNTTVIDFHDSEEKLIAWVKRQKKLEYEGKATIWTMKRDSVNDYVHPTQKPVELITYALFNSSKEGDIVLDLFGGSGSTMIACQKTGRIARIMELDTKYVETILTRFAEYTHIDPVRESDGMAWSTLYDWKKGMKFEMENEDFVQDSEKLFDSEESK